MTPTPNFSESNIARENNRMIEPILEWIWTNVALRLFYVSVSFSNGNQFNYNGDSIGRSVQIQHIISFYEFEPAAP